MSETLLSVRNLTKRFGNFTVTDEIDLSIGFKEVVGLIGPNGAGKTTLINILSGFLPADKGRVIFRGEDITNLPAYKIAGKGLVRSFQLPRPFCTLTLLSNCEVSIVQARDKYTSLGIDPKEIIDEVLQTLNLSEKKSLYPSKLSSIDLKLLEFCRALLMKPDLLLLDEPFVGMSLQEAKKVRALIDKYIVNDGGSVLIVEHNIPVVKAICDRLIVMNLGKIIADGKPVEVLQKPDVIAAYFGTD